MNLCKIIHKMKNGMADFGQLIQFFGHVGPPFTLYTNLLHHLVSSSLWYWLGFTPYWFWKHFVKYDGVLNPTM